MNIVKIILIISLMIVSIGSKEISSDGYIISKFTEVKSKEYKIYINCVLGNINNPLLESINLSEGGYSNDRKDTGNFIDGKFIGTNHGISASTLKNHLGKDATINDMKNLTKEDANKIIWNKHYIKNSLHILPESVQEIVLHGIVNSGGHAIKVMQKLIGAKVDGIIGPETISKMKSAKFLKKEFKNALLEKYKTFKTWKVHGNGWTKRFNYLSNKI